jgi:hypothetical protein
MAFNNPALEKSSFKIGSYIVEEYNPSMHNFNVAFLDHSYMFRLLLSNHHQAVYWKYNKEFVVHVCSG